MEALLMSLWSCQTVIPSDGQTGFKGPGGETGRHAVLRRLCRKASRFESASGHVVRMSPQ